jgi:hypothetical protein
MDPKNNYKWEAEKQDGTIITEGGDLTDCIRFSLIPNNPNLQHHDVAGVEMVRRFCRGFIRVNAGGLKEYVHCLVCKDFRFYVRSTDGTVLVTPADFELYL